MLAVQPFAVVERDSRYGSQELVRAGRFLYVRNNEPSAAKSSAQEAGLECSTLCP